MLDPDPNTRIPISRIKRSTWYRRPIEGHALKIKHETRDIVCNGEATTSDSPEHSNAGEIKVHQAFRT